MEIARYIIDNNTTVRQAAKHFGISKSTVHKDVTERLAQVNPSLAAETRKALGDVLMYRTLAGHQQVRAAHPRRDGDKGEVSASACVKTQKHLTA